MTDAAAVSHTPLDAPPAPTHDKLAWRSAVFWVALVFSSFQVITAAFSPISSQVVRAVHVGFVLLMIFLIEPGFSKRHGARAGFKPMAWVLGLAGFATGIYQWVFEADLVQRAGTLTDADWVVGVVLLVLVFEAARRTMGWALPIICALFLGYGLWGEYLPTAFQHRGYGLDQIIGTLSFGTEGLYGTPTYVSSSYIFLFILFGAFLEQAGMIQLFTDFAMGTVGHTRGGPAKVAVISSGLMGTINGSGVANVVTTGQFTIPLMKRFGYSSAFAGGVEAVLARHAELLANDGHDVRVVTGRGEPWDERIDVVRLPLADSRSDRVLTVKAELDRGFVTSDFRALAGQLRVDLAPHLEDREAIVMHNVASLHKNMPLTAALSRLIDVRRWVAWHHDFAWLSDAYAGELHAGEPWDLLRRAWRGVSQVTISGFRAREQAALMGVPVETIEVVPNGIDIPQFLGLDGAAEEVVERHRLLDRWPILLAPVRVTRRKNLEHALEVVAAVRRRAPTATLLITGPPGAHNPANATYLASLVERREALGLDDAALFLSVERGGALPESEIPGWYRLADALLLTSTDEGFGLPVLEGALAGLPQFCTDIPALRELAGDDATYFGPNAEPREVARAIVDRLEASPTSRLKRRHRLGSSWQSVYERQVRPLVVGA